MQRELALLRVTHAPQLFASPKPGEKPKSDKRKGASRKEYGIEQLRMTVQDLQHVMRNLGEPLTEDQVIDMASVCRRRGFSSFDVARADLRGGHHREEGLRLGRVQGYGACLLRVFLVLFGSFQITAQMEA